LVYCSNCGSKIDDEAYFCFKCGAKTPKGKAAKANYPSDEIREAFYQVGIELEKAFTLAAKETQAAFRKVSENMQQKSAAAPQRTVICSSCGTKIVNGAVFCNNCGGKVVSPEDSKK
jgi:uncharacterized membrane protein YvbJ